MGNAEVAESSLHKAFLPRFPQLRLFRELKRGCLQSAEISNWKHVSTERIKLKLCNYQIESTSQYSLFHRQLFYSVTHLKIT